MSNVNDFRQLLRTTKNRVDPTDETECASDSVEYTDETKCAFDSVEYTIFRRTDFETTSTADDSIITFCINVLESMRRIRTRPIYPEEFPIIVRCLATDSTYDCVQIVAKKDECSTSGFLCWAEDGELITGTAILRMRCKEWSFNNTLTLWGSFQKNMTGSIPPHFDLPTYAHDLGIARFSMMSQCTKEQLAVSWNESIDKFVV